MHPVLSVVLAAAVAAAAVPCGARLASGPESCCGPDRVDDTAELLICAGMLAMVSPVGGPIPLAGWRAVFAVAVVALAVRWVRARRCGHHAVMAAAMLYMFVAMQGHGGTDPWLNTGDHTLGAWPIALGVVAYCAFDLLRSAWSRQAARALSAATMGAMTLAML